MTSYTIPPNSRAVGTGNPALDMDNTANILSMLTGQAAGSTFTNIYTVPSWFNVVYYGADPTNTNDSTTAFQNALTAAGNAGGGVVYVPAGTYKITPPSATVPALTVPTFVTITGDGDGCTTLMKNGNGILLDFSGEGPISETSNWNLHQGLNDIALNGNAHSGLLIRLYYVQNYYENNVSLYGGTDVSVDMVQVFDSRFTNGIYLYGGSASASTISGGQAVMHLIRCSAAPATTLSSNISGTITSLPVVALPAALPAGIVQVWNAGGQLQNFTTTGAVNGATSIPVTSVAVAFTFVTGDAVNGFGWSGDSTNATTFHGCHWEDNISGAIWITGGVNTTQEPNSLFFTNSKCEQDTIGYNCPQIQVDSGTIVEFDHLYGYAGAFNSGYSTPVPFMQFNINVGTLSNIWVGNGAQVLTTGINITSGGPVSMVNIGMYWNTAPTSGDAITVGSGTDVLIWNYNFSGTYTNAFGGAGNSANVDPFGNFNFGQGGCGQLQVYGNLLMQSATEVVLAPGTTTVPPLGFSSGTNLTSPVAGAMEYDSVATYITNETTSGRGLNLVEQKFRLTSTGGTISTIANYFGSNSNIPLVSGGEYEIEVDYWFLVTTTDPVVWTFTNSAAPTSMNMEYKFSPLVGIVSTAGSSSLFGEQYNITSATATVTTGSLTSAVEHHHKFWIRLINGTGTSLKLQATKSTSGTITPGINSSWKSRRVPAANVGTFSA